MNIRSELLAILDDVLSLRGQAQHFTDDTALLGGLPEFDSMAVVGVLTSIEERFGIAISDDEIDGSAFATVGALTDFVAAKLA